MFMGTKTKYGYDVWFGFTDEMRQAITAAMQGATYDVQRYSPWSRRDGDGSRSSSWRTAGRFSGRWAETRPIKWTIRWEPDIHGGIWVLYVSARAAIEEAERRCIRAVRERLQPGTRVRLAHDITSWTRGDEGLLPRGTLGTVTSVDWTNGVVVAYDDRVAAEDGIGKFWVVPVDDTPTTPKPKAGGIYADERSVR